MAVFIVSFDNPQAGSRFIDYLNNMPDGKGINLFLSDHPAEVHKAAPDLLDACRFVRAHECVSPQCPDCYRAVRDAIAKAAGKPGA